MRRISTFSFLFIGLLVASINSFGQQCHVSTLNPNPTPAYGSTVPVQTSATPGADFNSSNQGTLGTFSQNSTTELTSRIVFYAADQNAVYFKYHLTGSPQDATPTQYSITLVYANNQTVTCGPTAWTAGSIPSGAGADYYFWIDGIGTLPANRNFRIRLTLTTDNRSVVATAFQTNATFPVGAAVLPVRFSNFEAKALSSGVALNWNVGVEENVSGYEIEKSTDGRSFAKIGFVTAAGKSSYSFVDSRGTDAVSYYRIRSVDNDGRMNFSSIVVLKGGKAGIVLKAFPSPFINKLSVQHGTATTGSLISISSEDGRMIKSIIPALGTQQTDIDLTIVKSGLYLVRYNNGNGQVETLKILKQ